jgi:hypothetical protein
LKVFLVPWFKTYSGVALRVYVQGYQCSNDYEAEISTVKGQKIALSLVQAHASSLRLTEKLDKKAYGFNRGMNCR